MPIKIFAAPGDHRDDFVNVEEQFNRWEAEKSPQIREIQTTMAALPEDRGVGKLVLTLVAHYDHGST